VLIVNGHKVQVEPTALLKDPNGTIAKVLGQIKSGKIVGDAGKVGQSPSPATSTAVVAGGGGGGGGKEFQTPGSAQQNRAITSLAPPPQSQGQTGSNTGPSASQPSQEAESAVSGKAKAQSIIIPNSARSLTKIVLKNKIVSSLSSKTGEVEVMDKDGDCPVENGRQDGSPGLQISEVHSLHAEGSASQPAPPPSFISPSPSPTLSDEMNNNSRVALVDDKNPLPAVAAVPDLLFQVPVLESDIHAPVEGGGCMEDESGDEDLLIKVEPMEQE
jgi:hypothetical protein